MSNRKADVRMTQEHRMLHDKDLGAAGGFCDKSGFCSSFSAAKATDKGGTSGGIAILRDKGLGSRADVDEFHTGAVEMTDQHRIMWKYIQHGRKNDHCLLLWQRWKQ